MAALCTDIYDCIPVVIIAMDKVKEKRSSDINHSNISLGTPAEVYLHLLDPGRPGAAQSRDQDHTLAILCSYGCFFLECGCHLFPCRCKQSCFLSGLAL